MTEVSLPAVRGFRMRRQHLIERAPAGNLLEGVEAVHGIQAQIAAHAQFAVAQRIETCRPPEIDRALWQDKSLIKTWAMLRPDPQVSAGDRALIDNWFETLVRFATEPGGGGSASSPLSLRGGRLAMAPGSAERDGGASKRLRR